MAGKNPTYVAPFGPIPMRDLTGDSHNQDYNQEYVDPTTNTERLPARPQDRSALEKTYARWCCGSILGIIAWIVVVFLLITVPIVVVALKNMNDKHATSVPANVTATTVSSLSMALPLFSTASPSTNATTLTVTISPTTSSSAGLATTTLILLPTSSSAISQDPTTVTTAQKPSVLVVPIYITASSPSAVPTVTATVPSTVATTTLLVSATLNSPDETINSPVSPTDASTVTSILTSTTADSPVVLVPQSTFTAIVTNTSTLTQTTASTMNLPAGSMPHSISEVPTLPTSDKTVHSITETPSPSVTETFAPNTLSLSKLTHPPEMESMTTVTVKPSRNGHIQATASSQEFSVSPCTPALRCANSNGPLDHDLAPTTKRALPRPSAAVSQNRIRQPYIAAVVLNRKNTKSENSLVRTQTSGDDITSAVGFATGVHARNVAQKPRRASQVESQRRYLEAYIRLGRMHARKRQISVSRSAESTTRPPYSSHQTSNPTRRPRASGTSIIRANFVTPIAVVLPQSQIRKHSLLIFAVVALALLLVGGICAVLWKVVSCWRRRNERRMVRSQPELRAVDASGPGAGTVAAPPPGGRRGGWSLVRWMSGRVG